MKQRILVVDDDAEFRELLKHCKRQSNDMVDSRG